MDEPVQSVQPDSGSNNFQKIAFIIFGFVVLIVLSEGAYLLYTRYLSESSPVQPALPHPVIEESPSPFTGAKKINLEKGESYFEYLRRVEELTKTDFVVEAAFNIIVSGRIVENKIVNERIDNVPYVYLIKLEKNGQTLTQKFSQDDFNSLKVYLISAEGAEKTPITINDVKPGDFAILKFNSDFLDTSSSVEITLEITRVNP